MISCFLAIFHVLYNQMCLILDKVPLDYIKWDFNRNLTEVFSSAADSEHQGEVSHRYILGLYDLMERLVTRYPNILFEGCSGGGGRFDAGILYYMPQSWPSDDTEEQRGLHQIRIVKQMVIQVLQCAFLIFHVF